MVVPSMGDADGNLFPRYSSELKGEKTKVPSRNKIEYKTKTKKKMLGRLVSGIEYTVEDIK